MRRRRAYLATDLLIPFGARLQNRALQSPTHFLFPQSRLHHLLCRMSDGTAVPRYSGRPKEGWDNNRGRGVFVAGTPHRNEDEYGVTTLTREWEFSSRQHRIGMETNTSLTAIDGKLYLGFPRELPISNAPHSSRPAISPPLF